ncbi:MAG: hypothetical protein ACI976_000287 [Aureispira sp.]|jgi:hypothetical protein
MTTTKTIFLLSFFFILTTSCDETKAPATEVQEETTSKTTAVATPIEEEESLIIFQNSFLNISPGSQIAEHETRIEKGLLQTGDGDFEIYNILDAQKTVVAYFLADPVDTELVGDIYVTSPLAYTEDDIRIGNTFGILVTKYETLEVHGSEIESQTFANLGSLSFKIDEAHTMYDLEISAVSKEAKIIEIVIKR